MSNLLTEVFFAPEEAEKLRVVENISLARLRELADAERDGKLLVRPNCERCKKYPQWDNCDFCVGKHYQSFFEPLAEPKGEATT